MITKFSAWCNNNVLISVIECQQHYTVVIISTARLCTLWTQSWKHSAECWIAGLTAQCSTSADLHCCCTKRGTWPPSRLLKFDNPYCRVKNQSCRKLYIWVSKPIRRKIQNQWKKLELNRAYQLREKSKKPPENTVFQKSDISGGFLDFSLNW